MHALRAQEILCHKSFIVDLLLKGDCWMMGRVKVELLSLSATKRFLVARAPHYSGIAGLC